ncbi:B-cell receptor CD22-like [Thalassophryne amazonica]|uniref:B-cell receptor CD22-like n=1 Tax=Thalassophryne amazonica TaxID=390379 RepID=UPI00147159F3|nr:B-cell receptor CD22-like [Thalassophryne amazonica]
MMGGGLVLNCYLLVITASVKGILAGNWSVFLAVGPICAVIGSSVIIPCSYDYPQSSGTEGRSFTKTTAAGQVEDQQYKVLSVMWCLEEGRCITPSYVFHSDGIFPDLSYQNRVEYLGVPGTKNCSLRISNLRQSDTGTYMFYLITNHPTEKMLEQSGIQLLVADSPSAVMASASPSDDITEGVALRLACCSPAAGPEAHVRWFQNTSATSKHSGVVWNVGEVTADFSGKYFCQIQTGGDTQDSPVLNIDVQYSPRHTSVAISPVTNQDQGRPVTLTCSSNANPTVHTYTWYHGAACLATSGISFSQGRQSAAEDAGAGWTLSSINVSADHHGQHCCVARNRHGSQTSTVAVNLSSVSKSSGSHVVAVGVTVAGLLAIIGIIIFIKMRNRRTSGHQSYVLTETNPPAP